MNRLHKKISLSLVRKLYICLFIHFFFGIYKNGAVPFFNGYSSYSSLFLILLYPILGFLIGFFIDKVFKNKSPFTNAFYGFLFSMLIPISTPIIVYVLFIAILLLVHELVKQRKDLDFHFLALGKLVLVFILFKMQRYFYFNSLENSHAFVYSFFDSFMGHTESGLYTSSAFLSMASFFFFSFDYYYKKEIPIYSYGIYLFTLACYTIFKGDMTFLLNHLFSSTILFGLVFLAPLSMFSPYTKKRIFIYSIFLGFSILPFSLYSNFYEGFYISLLLANFIVILLNWIQYKFFLKKNTKNLE